MRALATRILSLALLLALFSGSGWAYYYFVHYGSRSGPFFPIYEKWDLTALQNNTVYFYVSDTGPSGVAPGDSFQAILSEIRQAALEWNNVSTSLLKFAYGGLYNAGSGEVSTGVTVDFTNDLPPGVIALGGPITYAGPSNGQFVPILRSTIRVQADLSQPQTACSNSPCPSYSEYFYTTMVHEFGHTIGLQHTFTSAVMSTYITSAATKSTPLAMDDIIGVSLLYPAPGFNSSLGTITGTVSNGGTGVGMASVVAISTGNLAVSTITNPDGTYSLNVLPGAYQVYVHPIPPAVPGTETTPGNIVAPKDANGNAFPFPSSAFQTQFYPGTQDFLEAGNVYVNPAGTTAGINFFVKSKSFATIPSVRTYGYSETNVPVASPPIRSLGRAAVIAYGAGLLQNGNAVTPGLNISVMASGSGAAAQVYNVQPWTSGYLLFDVALGFLAGTGPKHLLFRTNDDLYVLPSAFTVVAQDPPYISSVFPATDANGNKVVAVGGTNLIPGLTRILFDGLPGAITGIDANGNLLVVPPVAPGSYRAVVTALNSDGQSSNYLQEATPPSYVYDPAPPPSLAVSPAALLPGNNVIDVIGTNTNFIDGQVMVGFGTSDAVVNKVTVLSPTHLSVNVTMNSGAFIPLTAINVVSGLNVIAQSQGSSVTQQASH